MSNLNWMLNRIYFMDKDSLVVVAGDFNIVGMKKTKFLSNKFNLTKALRKDMATHRKGGNLDKIWTNLETTSIELIQGLEEISDHSLIQVRLRISEAVKRKLPHKKSHSIQVSTSKELCFRTDK